MHLDILQHWDLSAYNTLGLPSRAEYYYPLTQYEKMPALVQWAQEGNRPIHILGGGSNVILAPFLKGLTLHIQGLEKTLIGEDHQHVWVQAGAGESWHEFVSWTLQQGYYGLENLALIPGTLGAAPVQNIGAYGVEVGHFIERVKGIYLQQANFFELTNPQCQFNYRDSIFKQALKDQALITHVIFKLNKQPVNNLAYPALRDALQAAPSPQEIFDTVCRIRRSKLPDPAIIPNCGSFFKNPIVPQAHYQALLSRYPNMPSFEMASSPQHRKLAAAWLIDQVGWKGKSYLGVQVHPQQALVLTNPHKADAQAVLALADKIQHSVLQQFEVGLEMEPVIMGFDEATR